MGCHLVSHNVTQNSTSHEMCYSGSEDLIDHALPIIDVEKHDVLWIEYELTS